MHVLYMNKFNKLEELLKVKLPETDATHIRLVAKFNNCRTEYFASLPSTITHQKKVIRDFIVHSTYHTNYGYAPSKETVEVYLEKEAGYDLEKTKITDTKTEI